VGGSETDWFHLTLASGKGKINCDLKVPELCLGFGSNQHNCQNEKYEKILQKPFLNNS